MIMHNAYEYICIKKIPEKKISYPWWNKACDKAFRDRNCAQQTTKQLYGKGLERRLEK